MSKPVHTRKVAALSDSQVAITVSTYDTPRLRIIEGEWVDGETGAVTPARSLDIWGVENLKQVRDLINHLLATH